MREPVGAADEAEIRRRLTSDVRTLAGQIGERNVWHLDALNGAADFIDAEFARAGYHPKRQWYTAEGARCCNIEVEAPGRDEKPVIVGAHYDTVRGSPGANDNASGIAALLALGRTLSRALSGARPACTLRLVAFTNEESPFGWTPQMGSAVYANLCRQRGDRVRAMLSMDGLGCYSDEPNSQRYPLRPLKWCYPSRGDFLAFVSNPGSASLLRRTLRAFRNARTLKARGAVLPGWLRAAGRSDHWAFWQQGYPALLATDTLPFRDPRYHTPEDTPEHLDEARLARAALGIRHAVCELAGIDPASSD